MILFNKQKILNRDILFYLILFSQIFLNSQNKKKKIIFF
jgi:hypothetical protein